MRIVIIAIFSTMLICESYGTGNVLATELDDIITQIKICDNMIINGKGKMTFFTSEGNVSYSKTVDFLFADEKIATEEIEITIEGSQTTQEKHTSRTFNGDITKQITKRRNPNGNYVLDGRIYHDNTISSDHTDPRDHGMGFFNTKLSHALQGNVFDNGAQLLDIVYQDVENIDELDCYLIEGRFNNNDQKVKIWIAPDRMYRTKKIEVYNEEMKMVYQYKFSEKGHGLWFVSQSTREMYVSRARNNTYTLIGTYTVEINLTELNSNPHNWNFDLEFPDGLEVHDNREVEQFKLKDVGSK